MKTIINSRLRESEFHTVISEIHWHMSNDNHFQLYIYIYIYTHKHTHAHVYIYIYIYREREREKNIRNCIIGIMVSVFANGLGNLGSIPGWVIPKTQKMVLDATLLNIQYYKVRIKGKVEQSKERSSTHPYTLVE